MYFAPGYTVDSQTPQTYPSRNALFNRTSSSPPYLHFKIRFPPSASPWSETSLLFSLRNEGATAPQKKSRTLQAKIYRSGYPCCNSAHQGRANGRRQWKENGLRLTLDLGWPPQPWLERKTNTAPRGAPVAHRDQYADQADLRSQKNSAGQCRRC